MSPKSVGDIHRVISSGIKHRVVDEVYFSVHSPNVDDGNNAGKQPTHSCELWTQELKIARKKS